MCVYVFVVNLMHRHYSFIQEHIEIEHVSRLAWLPALRARVVSRCAAAVFVIVRLQTRA